MIIPRHLPLLLLCVTLWTTPLHAQTGPTEETGTQASAEEEKQATPAPTAQRSSPVMTIFQTQHNATGNQAALTR